YRLKNDAFHAEADNLSSMSDGWMKMEFSGIVEDLGKGEKRGHPYYVFPNWAPRGDKRLYQTGYLFRVWDHASGKTAIGGVVLDAGIFITYRTVIKGMAVAKLKSDFVSNVSHELRTPLSLIRLYAETLELGRLTDPSKYQEYYQIIRKESERLSSLINNILDFSRIEAGRKEYDFRETNVRELVQNTLDCYRYQIEQNGFTFEEHIEDVPALRVDREAVARSLVNLINNALK